MIIESVILIEGQDVNGEKLRSLSIGNAQQLIVGRAGGIGTILHIAATSQSDLNQALLDFSKVEGVEKVTILIVRG